MKVIICGAGQIGYNITSYLCREDNDITVIDPDPFLIDEINNTLDANGIVGFASHPDKLKEAGIANADMIIAVTDTDEVNMVACQVAHSLFGVPKKIARIRTNNYLDPKWANLFARAHMPIDVIISPETEVAQAIKRRIRVPGTSDIIPLCGGKMFLVGVHCEDNCPIVNTPLRQLRGLFPDLMGQVLAIIRGQERIIADQDNQLLIGDEVYFLVRHDQLYRALAAFGHEEPEARHVVIFGGGNIGFSLAQSLHNDLKGTRVKVIELRDRRAKEISKRAPDILVLKGDGLSKEILEEARVGSAETFVAVSNDDENNVLASLLAKQYGCQRTMCLVNKPMYTDLTVSLGIDAVISPRAITVSRILEHVRRGRIKGAYNIFDGFAEVIEAEVSGNAAIANKSIADLDLPDEVRIGAIWRQETMIIPEGSTVIREKDIIVFIASQKHVSKIEKLFSVSIDILNLK